ncbi:unnamed protein product, partial [Brachionus calyciflorus]
MSARSELKKMSCDTRNNKRNSFINNFYEAYSKFNSKNTEKLMGKKEFRFRFNNKKFSHYKFPNINDDTVLNKGGDIFFDGKEFKVIQVEVSDFFDKKLLTIPEDPLVPLEENISETTLPSTSSSITISTVRNDEPSLLFETINGT